MSGIMGEKQTSSDSGGFTTDEFASFFVDKVEAVRQSTSSTPLHHVSETARTYYGQLGTCHARRCCLIDQ